MYSLDICLKPTERLLKPAVLSSGPTELLGDRCSPIKAAHFVGPV